MRRRKTISFTIALLAMFAAGHRAAAQTGACCDDLLGTCVENVPVANCMGFVSRYIDGGTCADFDPPCGVGVCCTTSGCVETTRTACLLDPDGYYFWPAIFCTSTTCDDCDGNGVPDGVEIAIDASLDCNLNGLLDRCEIDAGSTAPGGPFFCTSGDCAADCNNNGVPDECEIYEFSSAPGGPYFCTTGCDPDCNNNGIPDACDIDPTDPDGNGNVSEDVLAPIGVPDECRQWTGAVNDLWSEPGNWMPPTVPNNSITEQFSVVIDGSVDAPSANVEADLDVAISSLILRDDSVLTLTLGSLTLDGNDGIVNEGRLVIPEGSALNAAASFRMRGDDGVIQLNGDTATIATTAPNTIITNEITIAGRGVITGNLRNNLVGTIDANDPGNANAGALSLTGPMTLNNGRLVARLRATLKIGTDVFEEPGGMSLIDVIGANVSVGDGGDDGDDPEVVTGCGPIFLRPTDLTMFRIDRGELRNFTLWEIGDNSLVLPNQRATFDVVNGSVGVVAGPVNVRRNGTLTVDRSSIAAEKFLLDVGSTFRVSNGSAVTARGAFLIAGNDESLFAFASGTSLTFEGGAIQCGNTPWDRTLEAASRNLGPAMGDGGYDNNYDLGELRIAANGNLQLVDDFDNGNRPADGAEAVYCDTLVLESGATLFLNGISLFAGGQQVTAGPFGQGEVVERQACCLPAGSCVMEVVACCTMSGGVSLGAGSTCNSGAGGACPPIGACCLSNATCVVATPAVCIAQSGIYQGDATSCGDVDCTSPTPLPLPIGACCISDGSCNETTEADCTNGGAAYRGDDSTCDDVDCSLPAPAPTPAPIGACCMTDLSCIDLTNTDCTAAGGEFFGSNSNCGVVNCDIGDSPAAMDAAPGSPLVDEAICRLFRQSVCGIPGCAPCGVISLIATIVGIRRMRRRHRSRRGHRRQM